LVVKVWLSLTMVPIFEAFLFVLTSLYFSNVSLTSERPFQPHSSSLIPPLRLWSSSAQSVLNILDFHLFAAAFLVLA
jgi:hypothetical protein